MRHLNPFCRILCDDVTGYKIIENNIEKSSCLFNSALRIFLRHICIVCLNNNLVYSSHLYISNRISFNIAAICRLKSSIVICLESRLQRLQDIIYTFPKSHLTIIFLVNPHTLSFKFLYLAFYISFCPSYKFFPACHTIIFLTVPIVCNVILCYSIP